jgi:hypothetical protein
MRDQRTFNPEIDRAVRALNNSNLAVYPVDARGLRTSSLGAERATPKNITRGGTGQPPSAAIDPNFDSLEALASGTGGRAFHNLNDLAAAIKTATSDARVSYALAFSPPAETLDGRYHPLKVDVKRSGVHIRYRKGYFAYGDTPQPSLAQAIGSQAAFTGVGISVTLKPVENALMAAINVDAHNITLEQKDGKWEGALEFLVLAGKVAEDPKITPFNFKLTPEGYAQVQKEGLILNAKLPAPAGPVQYHVGVKDVASGAIGTLHLVKK